ncbi:MAG TPA: type II toxin-antitoxin system RelE/ParE family toxin [Sphingomonas sp.]|nr:type II toxin-antitoxin system RelE/ParE family toxin [Sphingomonas sp.]
MKVRISAKAQADLEAILNWIAQDDPATALRFGDALIAKAREIGEMPLAFRMRRTGGRWTFANARIAIT